MTRFKLSRLTLLFTLLLVLGASLDLMAIEMIRVRPRRVTVAQGDGAVLLVVTQAPRPERTHFVTDFDTPGLPPTVTATFIPDALLFPDRGHLFLDVDPSTPVGTYIFSVTGNVYDENGQFIRTIRSSAIRLTVQPPISPTGPNGVANKRRP